MGEGIVIPRKSRRAQLGVSGLVGKIEFNSNMTAQEMRSEICQVFSKAMGLLASDIKDERLFPFSYLQTNSNCLCYPSVAESFSWNGRQVSTLAKAGCVIYVLAEAELPGYQVSTNIN